MVPKSVCIAVICTALLAWSSVSMAEEYRPDEFLTLDLAKAVVSPKRLAPASDFEPVAVETRSDPGSEGAQVAPRADPDIVAPKTRVAHMRPEKPRGAVRTGLAHRHGNPHDAVAHLRPEKPRGAGRTELTHRLGNRHDAVAHLRPEKPRGSGRTRLAHRHGNPLDAEARDTRIQVWPCKSGGICDWQRAKN
jgi:hypothetical protein